MIGALALILCLQLAGTVAARVAGLPVPGPVLALIALFVGLALYGRVPDELERVARPLLEHLALLFVPAGVGVIAHLPALEDQWLAIAVTLLASIAATLVATAAVFAWVRHLTARDAHAR